MSSLDDVPQVPKVEHSEEDDFDESSPEADESHLPQEAAQQVQKRKGGRKPIYATSEERKQRNRQAQAAFRERRTEYIKQLETTIKHHEEQLQSLQQSHRSAADECLMLRYKNSLLERILLEKGVDVQAELKMKTEGSHMLPHQTHQGQSQPSAVQRAVMNRQGAPRRVGSASTTKSIRPHGVTSQPPPRLQPTPPSQGMSPASVASSHGAAKAMGRSMSGDPKNQKHRQSSQQGHPSASKTNGKAPARTMSPPSMGVNRNEGLNSSNHSNTFYPSPYQAHMNELEHEYETQADMLEDENSTDNSIGPGPPYSQFQSHAITTNQHMPLGLQGQPPMPGMQGIPISQAPPNSHPVDPNQAAYGMVNAAPPNFDYDPSLDAHPFGLTASMHFPTQFTYQENPMRR